jgi:SAM-dependent methyltransferase
MKTLLHSILIGGFLASAVVAPLLSAQESAADSVSVRSEPAPLQILSRQAASLRDFVTSDVAMRFLQAVPYLPAVPGVRVAYRNRLTRDAITEERAAARPDSMLDGYERLEMDEEFYYFTRYGTPLAFVRPLDLLGREGLDSLDGARIVDFGFGSIGHLHLLAANGTSAHGIEIDVLLRVLYRDASDTGRVARAPVLGEGPDGEIVLHFGQFPAEPELVDAVGGGYHAFVSKNTLKNGYIHPAEQVDPRLLVHLGVNDETFVRAVYRVLAPGGFFMIYNLYPPQSEERYIPWADGRSPFSRELLESVGFEVVAFNRDDTAAAREMGELLGWGDQMELAADLFGTYTLARKR